MNVFITGATGYIGTALVRALLRAGHEATGLVRSRAKAKGTGLDARWVVGDMKAPETYAQAAARADAIVHLGMEYGPGAAEVDGAALAVLLGAKRGPLVYTSGVWVLGSTGDRAADETAPLNPLPLVAWRPAHERRALDAGAAVVRPGIVFGGRGGLVASFFESADRDGAATYVGDGQNRWTFVHVEDLADLYVRALELWPDGERLYHAVGGPAERIADVARAASAAAGHGGETRAWPLEEARKKLGAFADALAVDQVVTAPRTEKALGWRPRRRGFVRSAGEACRDWSAREG